MNHVGFGFIFLEFHRNTFGAIGKAICSALFAPGSMGSPEDVGLAYLQLIVME